MDELRSMIGVEHELDTLNAALRRAVQMYGAPVVGAHEISCSDESELEAGASFQKHFVEELLPDLKVALRAPFRTRNLGARYEWGSVRVAEHHYALPASQHAFKVMLLKLSGHVSSTNQPGGPVYGPMQRYEMESSACGALHALLRGDDLPALAELREALSADGHERINVLLDHEQVAPHHRYLLAAIASSVLQARQAVGDILEHEPHSPTVYVVAACVTLNRPGPDTELLCGVHEIDRRNPDGEWTYFGLGDDPERYRVAHPAGRLHITES